MRIDRVEVFGIEESIRAAKLPMSTNMYELNNRFESFDLWNSLHTNLLKKAYEIIGNNPKNGKTKAIFEEDKVVIVHKENGRVDNVFYSDLPDYLGFPIERYLDSKHFNKESLEVALDFYKRGKILAQTKQGEGHDNFLNGFIIQFDLTFSNKAWVEFQRYHFVDFVSSESTIHRISEFNLDQSYNKYVDKRIVDIMKEKVNKYNILKASNATPEELKPLYLELLYSNPSGFELTARITTNYRQLKTMYHQRKNHKLPEWRDFCRWVETLPYSEFIVVL